MGQWNHMYCYFSKEKLPRPCPYQVSDITHHPSDITLEEVEIRVFEQGKHCQNLIMELNPRYNVGSLYSLQEMISMFDKRLKLCSLDEMIIIFNNAYDETMELVTMFIDNGIRIAEMIYLARIINMMKEKDCNYVWTRRVV